MADKLKVWECPCCGDKFKSNEPQSHQRDNGYKHCLSCRKWIEDEWPDDDYERESSEAVNEYLFKPY